jgi:hypothetical protein
LKPIKFFSSEHRTEDLRPMKNILRILTISATAGLFALPAFAQQPTTTAAMPAAAQTAQRTPEQEEEKGNIYKRWLDNRNGNAEQQKVAYEAGKEFIQKFGSDNDQYVKAVQNWVAKYEAAAKSFTFKQDFQKALAAKEYGRAFSLGRGWLGSNPDDTETLFLTTQAGFYAVAGGDKSLSGDATSMIRQTLQLIDQGRVTKFAPFSSRDETVAYMNYYLGTLLKDKPEEAAVALLKAAQTNSALKSEPSLYLYLGDSYVNGEYKRLLDDYKARFEGKEATDESRLALAKLNDVTDRIIDAYARAIAVSTKTDPQTQKFKTSLMAQLTDIYKARHDNSDAGLRELIANVQSRPLPLPGQSVTTPAPTSTPAGSASPASGSGGTATTTNNGGASNNGGNAATAPRVTTNTTTPATTPATTTTAKPANGGTAATKPATKTNGTGTSAKGKTTTKPTNGSRP